MRATLVMLQLFAWVFAFSFIGVGVLGGALGIAAVDLLIWLRGGAAVVAAFHLPVVAAVMLRRAARLTSSSMAI